MLLTHAYMSAVVPMLEFGSEPDGQNVVRVKAHTYSAELRGWTGRKKILRAHMGPRSFSFLSAHQARGLLRESAKSEAAEYTDEELYNFGALVSVICSMHGESFPTWVGDFYLNPMPVQRGRAGTDRLRYYLVTEAPGLDCGNWEEDVLPGCPGT